MRHFSFFVAAVSLQLTTLLGVAPAASPLSDSTSQGAYGGFESPVISEEVPSSSLDPLTVPSGFGPLVGPNGFGPLVGPNGFGPLVGPNGFGPLVGPNGYASEDVSRGGAE